MLSPMGRSKAHRAKLTDDQVREIQAKWDNRPKGPKGIAQKELADEYGVSPICIWHLVNHVTYAYIKR